MTNPVPPSDTIDITDLVEKMRQAWVTWSVSEIYAMLAAIPGIGWLGAWLLETFGHEVLKFIFDYISKKAEMMVFFWNTAVRKASQAKDFTNAVHAKDSLPLTASRAEYKNAEKLQTVAFRNLVLVTN